MQIIFFITEIIGVIAFALSGSVIAVKNRLDIFGILVLGTVTALGGGLFRDILLGHFPPRMFYNYRYLAVAAVVSCSVFLFYNFRKRKNYEKFISELAKKITQEVINIFDSIGLAIFTVVGCGYAIEEGYGDNIFFVVFLGTVTGVGGGVFRDVLSANVPLVLKKQIYATASIAGGIIYYFIERFGGHVSAIVVSILVILLIRIAAAYFRWDLPRITEKKD